MAISLEADIFMTVPSNEILNQYLGKLIKYKNHEISV